MRKNNQIPLCIRIKIKINGLYYPTRWKIFHYREWRGLHKFVNIDHEIKHEIVKYIDNNKPNDYLSVGATINSWKGTLNNEDVLNILKSVNSTQTNECP